jgi:hypothetical protein
MAVMSLPHCERLGTRLLCNIATSDIAAFVSGGCYRAIPWLVIGQRSLDREPLAVLINEDQKEGSVVHGAFEVFGAKNFIPPPTV